MNPPKPHYPTKKMIYNPIIKGKYENISIDNTLNEVNRRKVKKCSIDILNYRNIKARADTQ